MSDGTGRIVGSTQWDAADALVTASVPVGATVIPVDDTADFSDSTGLVLLPDGSKVAWSEVGDDDEFPTIILSEPLPVALAVDDTLLVFDPDTGGHVVELEMNVDIGEDDDPDVVAMSVDPDLWSMYLPESETDGKEVEWEFDEDDDVYTAVAPVGTAPLMSGAFIDPTTLPDPETPTAPPASSPAIKRVTGFPSGMMVEVEPVEASTQLRYYVVPEGVLPGPDDVSATTRGTVVSLYTLGDGSPLQLGATYDIYVEAFNTVGAAPMTGPEPGRLDAKAIEELIALRLVVADLVAGRLQIGQITGDPDTGITIPQPDGGVIHLPADGSAAQLTAYVVARGLTVEDALALYGAGNLYGTLTAAAGIAAPKESAGVTADWPTVNTYDTGGSFESSYYGLAPRAGSTGWVSAQAVAQSGALKFIDTSGAYAGEVALGKFSPLGGVTTVGSSYYVLGKDWTAGRNGDWWVRRIGSSGALQAEWKWRAWATVEYRPAIGTDGTNLLVTFCRPQDDAMRLEEWTTAGSQVTSQTLTGALNGIGLAGVGRGAADFGATRIWVAAAQAHSTVMVWDGSANRVAANDWYEAGEPRGLCWAGGQFVTIDSAARIRTYSGVTSNVAVTSQIAWYDPLTGGTGTHESTPSPVRTDTWKARTWLKFTVPIAPEASDTDPTKLDKATHVRLYAATGSGTRTLQATLDKSNRSTALLGSLATGGKTVEVVNGFLGISAPGVFRSAETYMSAGVNRPLTQMDGAGSFWALKHSQAYVVPVPGFSGPGTEQEVTVTFKTPFDVPPVVTATPRFGTTSSGGISITVDTITTTSVKLNCWRTTGSLGFDLQVIAQAPTL